MRREAARLADYLDHIVQAIDRIQRYVVQLDENSFLRNELIQDAVIRNLEVIGEASRNIETRFPEFTSAHPELPLAFAYQMRNAVSHGYFKVDMSIVWRTVHSDLLGFKEAVLAAARHLLSNSGLNPTD